MIPYQRRHQYLHAPYLAKVRDDAVAPHRNGESAHVERKHRLVRFEQLPYALLARDFFGLRAMDQIIYQVKESIHARLPELVGFQSARRRLFTTKLAPIAPAGDA